MTDEALKNELFKIMLRSYSTTTGEPTDKQSKFLDQVVKLIRERFEEKR